MYFQFIKPNLLIYFLQRRHEHCRTEQDLILLLKALSDVKFVNSLGIRSHICGPKDDKVSDPFITIFTFLRWNLDLCLVLKDLVFNLKTSVTISGARLCFTLSISISKFCRIF